MIINHNKLYTRCACHKRGFQNGPEKNMASLVSEPEFWRGYSLEKEVVHISVQRVPSTALRPGTSCKLGVNNTL